MNSSLPHQLVFATLLSIYALQAAPLKANDLTLIDDVHLAVIPRTDSEAARIKAITTITTITDDFTKAEQFAFKGAASNRDRSKQIDGFRKKNDTRYDEMGRRMDQLELASKQRAAHIRDMGEDVGVETKAMPDFFRNAETKSLSVTSDGQGVTVRSSGKCRVYEWRWLWEAEGDPAVHFHG